MELIPPYFRFTISPVNTMREKQNILDLEEIILKYKPLISYRVRKSIGYRNPDWEDIVAEIIINVIENVKKGRFKGESSISTFIYTITSRRIIDYIRQKKKEMRYVPEPLPSPDPYQQIEKKEKAVMLAKYIKKLKPRDCDILYSYYYGGLTQSEIAQIFGVSPSRISQVIHHAQGLLKKMIEG